MKRFDWLDIKWNKVKTKLLRMMIDFPFTFLLMQISSYSWNSPGENVAEKTFSRIPIFQKLEKKLHVRAMCAVYSPGIVQRKRRPKVDLYNFIDVNHDPVAIPAKLQMNRAHFSVPWK